MRKTRIKQLDEFIFKINASYEAKHHPSLINWEKIDKDIKKFTSWGIEIGQPIRERIYFMKSNYGKG